MSGKLVTSSCMKPMPDLLRSAVILERLPLSHGLPSIRHNLPASDYKGLCMITDATQLQKILSLADTAKPLDKEFKQLCDGDD